MAGWLTQLLQVRLDPKSKVLLTVITQLNDQMAWHKQNKKTEK